MLWLMFFHINHVFVTSQFILFCLASCCLETLLSSSPFINLLLFYLYVWFLYLALPSYRASFSKSVSFDFNLAVFFVKPFSNVDWYHRIQFHHFIPPALLSWVHHGHGEPSVKFVSIGCQKDGPGQGCELSQSMLISLFQFFELPGLKRFRAKEVRKMCSHPSQIHCIARETVVTVTSSSTFLLTWSSGLYMYMVKSTFRKLLTLDSSSLLCTGCCLNRHHSTCSLSPICSCF